MLREILVSSSKRAKIEEIRAVDRDKQAIVNGENSAVEGEDSKDSA